MPTNFYMIFIAALIPMIIGAIYYHPKALGSAWMKSINFTEKDLEGSNMLKIMGGAYLFCVLVSFGMITMVIHQTSVYQMMMPDVMETGNIAQQQFTDLMTQYGNNFRSFGHGAIHGVLTSILFVLPFIGVISLFERRSWKYIVIHWLYWAISLALVGGLLCATLKYAPIM